MSKATISLRITATAESEESFDQMIATTKAEILDRASHLYFGDGENYEQQHAIVETLEEKSQSLMIVELGHAAPLGDWFAAIDRAPCYHGSVSPRDARQLAKMFTPPSPPGFSEAGKAVPNGGQENIEAPERLPKFAFQASENHFRLRLDSHCGSLSITGSGTPRTSTGTTSSFSRLHSRTTDRTETQSMGGHPDVIQPRIAKGAMKFLRSQISRSVEGDQVDNPKVEIHGLRLRSLDQKRFGYSVQDVIAGWSSVSTPHSSLQDKASSHCELRYFVVKGPSVWHLPL